METDYKIAVYGLRANIHLLTYSKRGSDYKFKHEGQWRNITLDISDLRHNVFYQNEVLKLYNLLLELGKIKPYTKVPIDIENKTLMIEQEDIKPLTEILLRNNINFTLSKF